MPTYSYRCRSCGDEFDIQQSFSDDPLTMCEACGGELRKLFNSVGVVFKGSGFYRNDARGTSSSLTAKDSKPAAAPKSDAPAPAAASPAAS